MSRRNRGCKRNRSSSCSSSSSRSSSGPGGVVIAIHSDIPSSKPSFGSSSSCGSSSSSSCSRKCNMSYLASNESRSCRKVKKAGIKNKGKTLDSMVKDTKKAKRSEQFTLRSFMKDNCSKILSSSSSSSSESYSSYDGFSSSSNCNSRRCGRGRRCNKISDPYSDAYSVAKAFGSGSSCGSSSSSSCSRRCNMSYLASNESRSCRKINKRGQKYPSNTTTTTSSSTAVTSTPSQKRKFSITFGPKEGLNKGTGIWINGKYCPSLRLRVGFTYFFNVSQKSVNGSYKNSFYLCDTNGKQLSGSFAPISNGTAVMTITKKTPASMNYGDSINKTIDGAVFITKY